MDSNKELNELSINILVDAKEQYTKELSHILQPLLYEGISFTYDESENEGHFQELLRNIPRWNQNMIEDEVDRIIKKSKCDWLHDLVCAVFISNTKILTAVRTVNTNRKINLKIPNLNKFIHNCYIECAREFYKNPFLMDRNSENISVIDKQRNMRESLSIIDTCISSAVRKMLPFQQIIKKYLTDSYDEEIDIGENRNKYGKKMVKAFKDNLYQSDSDVDEYSEYTDNDYITDNEEENVIEDNQDIKDEDIFDDKDKNNDELKIDIENQMEKILNENKKDIKVEEQELDTKSTLQPEVEAEPEQESKPDIEPEAEVDVEPEKEAEQTPEAEAVLEEELEAEVVEEPEPEPEPEPEQEQEQEQEQELEPEQDDSNNIKNINISINKKNSTYNQDNFDNIQYIPNKNSDGTTTFKEVVIEKKDINDDIINKTSLSSLNLNIPS